LDDFLHQFKLLRRMGPRENVLGMLPGMDRFKDSSIDEKQLRRVEAIILSMTRSERARPDLLNARRRQRVARGSGSTVTEVNNLLLRFNQMPKMMKKAGQNEEIHGPGPPGGHTRPGRTRPTARAAPFNSQNFENRHGSGNPTQARRRSQHPYYKIVVAGPAQAADGKFIEIIGTYDPKKKGDNFTLQLGGPTTGRCRGSPWQTVGNIITKARKKVAP
jgi:ribosomal protein S16